MLTFANLDQQVLPCSGAMESLRRVAARALQCRRVVTNRRHPVATIHA